MNDEIKKFILLVEVHFPRQKFSGDEAKEALWLRSMSEILGQYEPEVLSEAAATIVRTRDPQKEGTMFPKPQECIKVCEAILRRKAYENMPMFSKSGEAPAQITGPANLPEFRITREDVTWKDWIRWLESHERKDMAQAAEIAGYMRTSSIWPRDGSVVFEPKESGQYAFAQLRQMN